MSPLRKTALVAGALYLITFATSIPARVLFGPVRNDPTYVLGPGPADTQILFAGLLDVLLAFACIGTAIALYPVVKRQNQGVALGFVGSRTLEAAIIVTGVIALLSVVTLRQAGAGADALGASHALVAMYNWTFLFGPGFMACVNALLLGSLLYRSGLVPRIIPLVGLIGAPLLFASDHRRPVRRLGPDVPAGGDRRRADRTVGGLPRRLAGRQGLQAVPDHRAK